MKPSQTKAERILIVDDEAGMCRLLKTVFEDCGYAVAVFQKSSEAADAIKAGGEPFDLVITDVRMPAVGGLDLLQVVRAASPDVPVVLISAHGTVELAVEAMKQGANDYVLKPFSNDEIRLVAENLLEKGRLIAENKRLRAELAEKNRVGGIPSRSPRMLETNRRLAQLTSSDVTVLLEGESGTGKELAARALHFNGPRAGFPFVVVHCGALPESLMESELFGHVRGAFTDAAKDRRGLFESAEGGSIFLDEIGEMPPSLQVKLLRFLQDHEVRRVGSSESRKIDVRVLAATNKDLRAEVAGNRFREDLYYRLAVVPITLLPLRERKEDLPVLLEHFLTRAGEKAGKPGLAPSPEALRRLLAYDWPGNVRELESAIDHAAALCASKIILPEDLPRALAAEPLRPPSPHENAAYRDAKQRVVEAFDKEFLLSTLRRCGGSITRAAEAADMDRKNFHELLKKYGLSAKEPLPPASR
ncbi:MAG: sigma-54-dependent transcriptional regulator [Elusimicrobiota bacterium]